MFDGMETLKNKFTRRGSRMDSSDSRLTIAILSQNNRNIGLFEHVRVSETLGSWQNTISYFQPYNNGLQDFVSPRAELTYDTDHNSIHTEHIGVVVNTEGVLTNESRPIAIQTATLFRLPFRACFWETHEEYPVYAMNPDYLLPWGTTVTSIAHLPTIVSPVVNHYRLQTSPLSSPRSPQSSPQCSPRRTASTIKRTLSTTAVCPITLGALSMATVYWTPCGHAFSSAIEEALRRDPRCPMCRHGCRFKDCAIPA